MRLYVLISLLFLLSLSCIQPYYAGLPARPTDAVVVTTRLLKRYHLTTEKLKNIHVYLGNELVISREISQEEANPGRYKNIVVKKNNTEEILTFPRWVRGTVIGMKKQASFWQKLQKKYSLLLLVSFENDNQAYLTFRPNDSGGYILNTFGDGQYVKYNNSTYRCISEYAYIELMVDLEIVEKSYRQRRTIRGRHSKDKDRD